VEKNVPVAEEATTEQVLPARVQEALGELAGAAQEGLLALSVGVGLGVLHTLMEEELDEVVGPKGRHDAERTASRHGHENAAVTLGGRRVPVSRPRARSADGQAELALQTYAHFVEGREGAADPPSARSPSRRLSSRRSATTRSTIVPTVFHPIRSSPAIGVLAICWASHATTSSKSRVCAAPGRAHGTASSRTPQSGQRSRRSSHSITHRLAPRSRWRQRLTRRSWTSSRPTCPHAEQTRRRRRNRTHTITPSAPKLTSLTDAPGRRSIRLNAVPTRMSPS